MVTANKQLLAQHGDELFDVAREAGVQIRFEAAVAGVIPIVRVIQESFGATEISKVFGIVNGTTNFILSEMAATGAAYEDVLERAKQLGYAEADPTEDVNGADAAAKMAILARLAFHTPITLGDVAYEGIETIQPDDLAYAKELGLSLKLLGVAERRDGGHQRPRLPLLPLRRPPAGAGRRALQRGHGRGARDHRGDDVRPRRRRHCRPPRRCSATSSRSSPATLRSASRGSELTVVTDVSSSFYLHLEVADRPGVLARIAQVLGDNGISVKSVVQRGIGDDARLVMVVHECLESQFAAAVEADRPARGRALARRARSA